MPATKKQPTPAPSSKTPPPKKKDPKDVPLGTGLADRAKQAIVNRKKLLDET